MYTLVRKTFQYGEHTVILETGEIARQCSAVMARMGDAMVLATVAASKNADEGRGFFPLTVNYQEKTYAAGKIPGGFFKREGRPSESETLVSRLIDRPVRPLFPKGFSNEVQLITTVLSAEEGVENDILAMIAASAALSISGLPFAGPIGAARVGYQNGEFLLNPSKKMLGTSELDLVVAGTKSAVLMVESEARELSEMVMLDAVSYGHDMMQVVIDAINEFTAEVKPVALEWQPPQINEALQAQVAEKFTDALTKAYQIQEKLQRQDAIAALKADAIDALSVAEGEEGPSKPEVQGLFEKLEKQLVRQSILSGNPRIDGRDTQTVRPIRVRTKLLPRVHGSALFTRGETQAIVAATLGTEKDAQLIDALMSESRDTFMLHYNFPPYSVGEVGFMGSPKRREIGHGRLARRAMRAVIPTQEQFPYTLRVVSEITESNGSSSMASVCGTSLALMDAGVPLKAPVAGIAMGLIKEDQGFAVLTDILGDEDHLGDMDFKVAGTAEGVTALQMDIKIEGITKEIMQIALAQAQKGRLHILDVMKEEIQTHRDDISEHAPRIISIQINPDKIRDVIGKGGATIRALTEETGATIDISDEGLVRIASVSREGGDEAKARIELLTTDLEVGKLYQGKVIRVVDFGAFVNLLPGKDGLLHISQLSEERVENVTDMVNEGDNVTVKVMEIDRQGRVRLSMKASVLAETAE